MQTILRVALRRFLLVTALACLSGCVSAPSQKELAAQLPPGMSFLFAQSEKRVGTVQIWAVDGQRVGQVKIKPYGEGAYLKAGPRTIRLRLEKKIPLSGGLADQVSLPMTVYPDQVYCARFAPVPHPSTGKPSYHIWIENTATKEIMARGPYVSLETLDR